MKLLSFYLLNINIAGFILFGIDKLKAIHNKWRIRESTLILFALLGGSAGCLLGMRVFHHKTRHRLFTVGIPAILLIELLLGMGAWYYLKNQTPYWQDPEKLVSHELSLLKKGDPDTVDQLLTYQDIFPTEDTDKPIPDEIAKIFTRYFTDFSYNIISVQTDDHTSRVTVALTTPDGLRIAREYSRQTIVKQIQNSAAPANVEFSLEDCYLLLGTVLENNTYDTVQSEYTIDLTFKDGAWTINSPKELSEAVTGEFSSHVSDADLFTPSEIVEIHLDTLKSFDIEQLNRYLALDNLFSGDAEYKREISRALASQLLSYLDYKIYSENITDNDTAATIEMELTSCDCSSMMKQYQEQVMAYTNTSQALQDGISGRLNTANRILVESISGNTASVTTPLTLHMRNDGTNWKMEMSDEMGEALLGNIGEAVEEVTRQLS